MLVVVLEVEFVCAFTLPCFFLVFVLLSVVVIVELPLESDAACVLVESVFWCLPCLDVVVVVVSELELVWVCWAIKAPVPSKVIRRRCFTGCSFRCRALNGPCCVFS